jgi:16S rRNA (cytosine967-C5)-methyltransferase
MVQEAPLPKTPREAAVEVLRRWEKKEGYAQDLLDLLWSRTAFSRPDKALSTALVNGAVRRRASLDWVIDSLSPQKQPSVGSIARQILRLAIFQHLYLERIPDYALVHEAVEFAKLRLSPSEAGYINALLRQVTAAKAKINWPPADGSPRSLAVLHSHPEWLLSRWLGRWDLKTVEEICRTDNAPPPIFIRINRLRTTPDRVWTELTAEGVSLRPVASFPDVFALKGSGPVAELKAFRQGHFQVQDLSTIAVAAAVEAKPGQTVIDFCAAPGGKMSFLAQAMQNRGTLIAADLSEERLKALQNTVDRLGASHVRVEKFDLLQAEETLEAPLADRILLDVPCSNTGVLRRRVDVRWRLEEKDIVRLASQGRELLGRAVLWLKTGGSLTYSTCSIETEENEGVVEGFLKRHPEFRLLRRESRLPSAEGGDGYFFAVIRKVA